MSWTLEFEPEAKRDLDKLDSTVRVRIFRFLYSRLLKLDDPRSIGEALRGSELGAYWKYRVGDYRIIVSIQDKKMQIIIVRVGNRRDVYR